VLTLVIPVCLRLSACVPFSGMVPVCPSAVSCLKWSVVADRLRPALLLHVQGKSDNEVMRFCQSFMTELCRYLDSCVDLGG
jgi:hypothetical protein